MKNSQKGFTALVAVVLAIAGGAWYYEAHSNSIAQAPTQSTSTSATNSTPTINVIFPASWTNWTPGSTQTIVWTDTAASASTKYDVSVALLGNNVKMIASGIPGTSYSWAIPSTLPLVVSTTIKVCETGTTSCGQSGLFNFVSGTKTTSTYQNADYGVSFNYPNNWTVKPGDTAEGDYGLYTKYDPHTISLVTAEIPRNAYPGTGFGGAYFNLSVDKQLSQIQCAALIPPFGPNNIPDKIIDIDGVMFTRYAAGSVAAGTAEYIENYSGYANSICYEFNLGDITGSTVSNNNPKPTYANDISVLEGVLSSVKFSMTSTTN
jgi:hypothetical protein